MPVRGDPALSCRPVGLATGQPAVLWEPVQRAPRGDVGFLVMHPDVSFIDHVACRELARRGYRTLGANTRYTNFSGATGGPYPFPQVLPDVAAAVEWLRDLGGVRSVVLVGHSGGGPLMAAYQNLAENGSSAFDDPRMASVFASLPPALPADGLVTLDAHLGYAPAALMSLDPAVVDEDRPRVRDPQLDMYAARNGYTEDGAQYAADFVSAFCEAQAARMHRIVERAESRRVALDAGRGNFVDDEPLIIPGMRARPWLPDARLLSRTRATWPVLAPGGEQPPARVSSLRAARPTHHELNTYPAALVTSVRSFLATHAIRTRGDYRIGADSVSGIDWASSVTSTPANLTGVKVPVLSMAMTGHYFLVHAETNFANTESSDKELLMVRGAEHSIHPLHPAEHQPGEFGDTVAMCFDRVVQWTEKRFQ